MRPPTINSAVAALRFFFSVTLDRSDLARHLTFVREPRRIPVVLIVPGGGLSADGSKWVAGKPSFFLPVRVLSRLFRRLFLSRL